jgi:RNA polymerase-binding transcription factor DksA
VGPAAAAAPDDPDGAALPDELSGPPIAGTDTRRRLTEAVTRNDLHIAELERDHARIVEAAADSNADDEHDPEGATIAFEREQLTALLDQARRTRDDLAAALTRIEQGTYGTCRRCGGPIAPGRLEARPTVHTCITCAPEESGRRR